MTRAVGDFRRDRLQAIGDIFVGEAVEAVAANALRVETFRQGEVIGNRAMTAVESRIEAGDLRQLRKARAERLHGGEIVRLMQRRQRDVALELGEDGCVDQDRLVVFRSAVHDAVPDSGGLEASVPRGATRRRQIKLPGRRSPDQGDNLVDQRRRRSAASARNRGFVPIPSICPLSRRRGSARIEHLELDAG